MPINATQYPEIKKEYDEKLSSTPIPFISRESDLDFAAKKHAEAYLAYRQLDKMADWNESRSRRSGGSDPDLRDLSNITNAQRDLAYESLVAWAFALRHAISEAPANVRHKYGKPRTNSPDTLADVVRWGEFNELIGVR